MSVQSVAGVFYAVDAHLKEKDCTVSYIGERCRPLEDRVKEHIKEGKNSDIHAHCSRSGHPIPTVEDFTIIDREQNQVRREAKEAIHIRKLDPKLNRNIGRMTIPHSFDILIGAKPKNNRVMALSQTQLDPANLLEMSTNRVDNPSNRLHRHIPRSTRSCRATSYNNNNNELVW